MEGPIGRPAPLESRFGGPWYREVNDLPTKGTAPKSALPLQKAKMDQRPQRVRPVSWPALLALQQTRTRDQTRLRPLHITRQYRKHEAPIRRQDPKPPKHTQAVYRGPEEGDGHRPPNAAITQQSSMGMNICQSHTHMICCTQEFFLND